MDYLLRLPNSSLLPLCSDGLAGHVNPLIGSSLFAGAIAKARRPKGRLSQQKSGASTGYIEQAISRSASTATACP